MIIDPDAAVYTSALESPAPWGCIQGPLDICTGRRRSWPGSHAHSSTSPPPSRFQRICLPYHVLFKYSRHVPHAHATLAPRSQGQTDGTTLVCSSAWFSPLPRPVPFVDGYRPSIKFALLLEKNAGRGVENRAHLCHLLLFQ